MAPGADLADAWTRLEAHLEWAGPLGTAAGEDPSWVAFVFAGPTGAEVLRQRTIDAVATDGGTTRVLLPDDPQGLRERLRDLVASTPVDLVWLEALKGGPGHPRWMDAWDDLLMRLNERREALRRGDRSGLVIVAHPALKRRIREAAPDLWSIRSLVLEVDEPGDRSHGPEGPAARANAHAIAHTALRIRFHHRIGAAWQALVVGDDPAPRRRFLDALRDTGLEVRVHGSWSQAADRLDAPGLHWVSLGQTPPADVITAIRQDDRGGPILWEVSTAGETALLRSIPDLWSRCALALHLYVERTPPPPLPELSETRSTLDEVWAAVEGARRPSDDPAAGRRQIQTLAEAVAALMEKGWTTEAAPLAAELLATVHAAPPDPALIPLLADAEELSGSVARHLGDLAEARARYHAALPHRRTLAQRVGPDRRTRRAELARCLSMLGQINLKSGDLTRAKDDLQEALALRRRLARASDDRASLGELAMSWSLLGDLELARHDVAEDHLEAADKAHREAMHLRSTLAGVDPAPRNQRMLSLSWGRLGKVAGRRHDWDESHACLIKSQALALEVAASDPDHVGYAMEASVVTSLLGDAARALGDDASAEAAYRHAVDQREAIVARSPENARWQELLAIALSRLGDTALERGDLETAVATSKRATDLSEQLAAMDPTHLGWSQGLARAWIRRGDVARASEQPQTALSAWRRAAAIAQRLAELDTEESGRRASRILETLTIRGMSDDDLAPVRDRIRR